MVQSCHMESSSDGSSTPKRAPRQRASRSSVRATRSNTERRVTPKLVEKVERVVTPPERKAPTPIASGKELKKKRRKQLLTAFVVLVIGIGTSAAVGSVDKGQIDVQRTIQERNERIRTNTTDERDVNTQWVEVPVQNTDGNPKGGLVGAGKSAPPSPAPTPVVASTTAASTEQTDSTTDSTSTEEVTDEVDSNDEETTFDTDI